MNEYSVNIFCPFGYTIVICKKGGTFMIAWIILLVVFVIVLLVRLDLYIGRKYFSTHAFERSFDQTSGDAVFYHDGEPLFDQLLTDIQQASSSIHMMFFIVKNDKIGQRILQALKAKA